MKWSFPMGRVAGIPIRMHVTFILVLVWIAWLGWESNGLVSSLWALALINGLFACVVLHELAHSLVAIRFGAEVRNITLLPIGGVASMKSIPEKPYQEFLVSVAGPLTNVLIVLILTAARGRFPSWQQENVFPASGGELLDALIWANLILAVFNLVPAFPMDGGRVLRSLLALFLPYRQATTAAATIGQLLAVGFILVGLLTNPFLVIIGLFVFFGAEGEERSVRIKSMLRDVLAEDVMVTGFVRLQPGDTVGRCLEYVYHHKQEDFPVELEGRLVGIVPRKDWLEALHRDGVEAKVADIMRRHFVVLHPKADLAKLYQQVLLLHQGVFPVVDEGRLVGLLTAEDISRFLMVREAQEGRRESALHQPSPGPKGGSRFTVDMG